MCNDVLKGVKYGRLDTDVSATVGTQRQKITSSKCWEKIKTELRFLFLFLRKTAQTIWKNLVSDIGQNRTMIPGEEKQRKWTQWSPGFLPGDTSSTAIQQTEAKPWVRRVVDRDREKGGKPRRLGSDRRSTSQERTIQKDVHDSTEPFSVPTDGFHAKQISGETSWVQAKKSYKGVKNWTTPGSLKWLGDSWALIRPCWIPQCLRLRPQNGHALGIGPI